MDDDGEIGFGAFVAITVGAALVALFFGFVVGSAAVHLLG
jgi:hypothetical protein